ncbi:hypothetical protein CHUAL_006503 [Chamberlinius hualienensis]
MLLILLIVSVVFAVAQQATDCDNRSYTNVIEAINGVSNCNYATENFNPACVEASLPALSSQSLCPVNSDGSVNKENLNEILNIIKDGFKQSEICNQDLSTIFYPITTFDGVQMLPKPITGECKIPRDSNNNITNIQDTQISLINSTDTGKATVFISVTELAYSAVTEWKFGVLSKDISMNFPIKVSISINGESSFTITNNNTTFTIDSTNVITNTRIPTFNNPLLTAVPDFCSNMLNSLVQKSTLTKSFINFISAIILNSIIVSTKNC